VNISATKFLNEMQSLAFIYLNNFELLIRLEIPKDNTLGLSEFDGDDELFVAD